MREKASPTAMARSSFSPVTAPATSSSAIRPKDTSRVQRKAEVRVFHHQDKTVALDLSSRENLGDRLRSRELTPSRSNAPTRMPVERSKSRRHKDRTRFRIPPRAAHA